MRDEMQVVFFLGLIYVRQGNSFIRGPFLGKPEDAMARAHAYIASRQKTRVSTPI